MFPPSSTRWASDRRIDWGVFKWRACVCTAWTDEQRVISDHTLVVFSFPATKGGHDSQGCLRWLWPVAPNLPASSAEWEDWTDKATATWQAWAS
eukprot:9679349-Alexandrium_andersonii.AAC.1